MTEDEVTAIVQVKILKQKVEDFIIKTDEFREELLEKVDKMNERLYNLPCSERRGTTTSVLTQLKLLWTFVTLLIGASIASWFKK